ncbi:UDP-N-acetylglucosamine 2-epimerase (non-hydrolyzing) [Bosea sp. TWI1241]|uniref:non-hydrolyzing UDP-N-acetylglucosamine 2-epimerase n=1 Tax=Bosea sp. TWI1241 TaxID=3148904 RepID=UPI00320A7896
MAKILTVVGARPQFIKAAPVSHALAAKGIREILVHTGQHFDADMSDIFFDELNIPAPTHNLDINSVGHGAMTGRMLEKLEAVMLHEKPDMVLVYGDTNSTMAGALAAAKLHIPVAHVEAGLRSFNRKMPEEINRVVTDHVSALLFCPTRTAIDNLAHEGVTEGVHATGDVMYDTTLAAIERAAQRSTILETLSVAPKTYAVSTIHRAENTDDPDRLTRVFAWLGEAARQTPILMPLHPRTRKLIADRLAIPRGITLLGPLGYLDMTQLVHHATGVFTDSGGLQKEAYFHGVPCITLRDETEWVETIEAGWNRLWTTEAFATPRSKIEAYGEGRASQRIVELIADHIAG